MTIGERIRELRTALDLTQKEVADAIGVRERYISDWELNKLLPNTRHIAPLAAALQTSADFLLTGIDRERRVTA